ncbi:MAG: hypothetical protein LBG68_04240 [Coriobacteriales bacterium]|jgi:adenine phosphoribosyltransferase|nr:hypothetical protein [Coriobacteriales bacterium]
MSEWPGSWPVDIGAVEPISLPLVRSGAGFGIYALDMMGQTAWNEFAATALKDKLAGFDFDILLTAEAKAIGLAQELANSLGHSEYVVLRKSLKLYMPNPVSVAVQSITTTSLQHFYLGQDKLELLKGKKVCILDDVLSTGGTLRAMLQMAERIDCQVIVIAVVLTEEVAWQEFEGVPVVSLDHIPLPAMSEQYSPAEAS